MSDLHRLADDTDVFILGLALCSFINSKIFIRRGTKTHTRLVDTGIIKLATVLSKEVCSALTGLHTWTGCDTIVFQDKEN